MYPYVCTPRTSSNRTCRAKVGQMHPPFRTTAAHLSSLISPSLSSEGEGPAAGRTNRPSPWGSWPTRASWGTHQPAAFLPPSCFYVGLLVRVLRPPRLASFGKTTSKLPNVFSSWKLVSRFLPSSSCHSVSPQHRPPEKLYLPLCPPVAGFWSTLII